MADEESKESSSKTTPFEDLFFLVWGPNIKEEVFKRWTQGLFYFLMQGYFNFHSKQNVNSNRMATNIDDSDQTSKRYNLIFL